MFLEYPYSDIDGWGGRGDPARQRLFACGYDPACYISTAALMVAAYTNTSAIVAKYGSMADLIAATDDDNSGNLNQGVLDSITSNATKEINGFISTIYPIPLAKTGTVSIIRITNVDSSGVVTAISVVTNGSYLTTPATANTPAYLRYLDPLANCDFYGPCWQTCQLGTGLSLTVAYTNTAPFLVSGTPVILSGGTGYQINELVVLTGGSSYVPDKIANAATTISCFDLARRRLAPTESNNFAEDAKSIKKELMGIGNGELDLDGTYRSFYSPVTSWNTQSVLAGANSL